MAAHGIRNEALYVVAVHTGLRQGELLGLKWIDVDLAAGKLTVRRSLKVTEDGLDFAHPKNKASRRSVPLNKTSVSALRSHRLRQNEERVRSRAWCDTDLVFPNHIGGPTTTTSTTGSTSRSSNAPGLRTRALPSTRCGTPSRRPC
jgi:integrase